jgi:hypothetical protein
VAAVIVANAASRSPDGARSILSQDATHRLIQFTSEQLNKMSKKEDKPAVVPEVDDDEPDEW